jgi:hypothetical protein
LLILGGIPVQRDGAPLCGTVVSLEHSPDHRDCSGRRAI